MLIHKRNGELVPYDGTKIYQAMEGAFTEVGDQLPEEILLDEVEFAIGGLDMEYVHVEQIQDIVERVLMEFGHIEEARAYIKYRYEHELARQERAKKKLREKIEATNVQNQNANVDEKSFGGRIGEMSDEILREMGLQLMSKTARDNHINNEIYTHDLSWYKIGAHNCLSVSIDELLAKGFNTRQTDVRPANSINTALQLVAVIFQLQSLQMFGGVACTHLDHSMVPYVRKSFLKHYKNGVAYLAEDGKALASLLEKIDDNLSIESEFYKNLSRQAWEYAMDMTEKETRQGVEGLYHNLNTLQSRSGYSRCPLP